MRSKNLVTDDGIALMYRSWDAADGATRTAFVTHSQAQHSLNLEKTLAGFADKGWVVHSADLRGHGYSAGPRAPLAHMDVNVGWNALVADLRFGLQTAFDGIPWQERLVAAPNIGAPLVLEVLKTWPDLAKNIVFITPPPNQPTLLKLARSLVKARMLLHPANEPDELIMHQLYTFLGARLSNREKLIDVVSSDRQITDQLIDDPYAWPTPTTGYFHEMFRGVEEAWKWPAGAKVADGTRMLVMYGGDDPMTANGKLVGPMRRHFATMGIEQTDAHCVKGGRSGLFIEEERFEISSIISGWVDGVALPESIAGSTDMAAISSHVLSDMGFQDIDRELSADELVELCYTAIDDESRWVEMLYRVSYAISSDKPIEEGNLEAIVLALMPHWDRSLKLNRQIMQSAAIGAVLQNVIERLNIGIAIVTQDMDVTYANKLFARKFGSIVDEDFQTDGNLNVMSQHLKRIVAQDFVQRCKQDNGEAHMIVNGDVVGFHFRPAALRQTALQRGGASGVLILRRTEDEGAQGAAERIDLLQFAYGLTAREADIALGVLDGLSPDAIAKHYDVSINTTRTHLKRIYEKVGVQGQAELASRLLRGPFGLVAGY